MREDVEWYAWPRVPVQEAYPSAARSCPSPDVAGGAALGMERRRCSPTIPRVIPVIGWPFPGPSAEARARAPTGRPTLGCLAARRCGCVLQVRPICARLCHGCHPVVAPDVGQGHGRSELLDLPSARQFMAAAGGGPGERRHPKGGRWPRREAPRPLFLLPPPAPGTTTRPPPRPAPPARPSPVFPR